MTRDKAKNTEAGADTEDKETVTIQETPQPNALLEGRAGEKVDAKDPPTVPYVDHVKQVVQVPNTQPAPSGRTRLTPEEQIIRADRGERSVENTDGLERDPQHAAIVHSQHGVARIETEAEKVARTGNAGVNIARPTPGDRPMGSSRLGAEQEAGRQTLERKHGNFARENERTAHARKNAE